jgi:hypothetical protein
MRLFCDGRHRLRPATVLLTLAVSFGVAPTAQADAGQAPAAAASEVLVTSTAVAPNADGRMTLLAADSGRRVWSRTQVAAGSETWSNWSLFASALTTVVAQRNGYGLIEVFGVDGAGTLWHQWQLAPNSEHWSRWEQFAVGMSDAPSELSVTAAANGTLTLFGLAPDGQVRGWTQYIGSNGSNGGGSWSPGGSLDGSMATIAAQTNGNGLIELFGTATSGTKSHRWETTHNTGSWAPWDRFGPARGPHLVTIAATTMGPDGAVVVFGTDSSAQIWSRTAYIGPNGSNGDGTWSFWTWMDGTLTGITAVGYPDRRIELFGIDGDGRLLRRKEITPGAGHWSAWETMARPVW